MANESASRNSVAILRDIAAQRIAQGREEHADFLLLMALYFEAKGIE